MDSSSSSGTLNTNVQPRKDRWPLSPPINPPSSTNSMQANRSPTKSRRSTKRRRRTRRSSSMSNSEHDVHRVRRTNVRTKRATRHATCQQNGCGRRCQCDRLRTGPCILRVINLDKYLDSGDVCNIFKHYGPIMSVKLHYNHAGSSIGIADVVYMLRKYALRALRAINRGLVAVGQMGLKAKILPWKVTVNGSKK